MLNHSKQQPLTFEHRGDVRVFRDMRRDQASVLHWDNCNFVGFKVVTPSGEYYHHALIIADSHAAFLDGIAQEYQVMIDHVTVKSKRDISLVFMHNLVVHDPSLGDAGKHYEAVFDQIHSDVSNFDAKFLLVGFTETSQLFIFEGDTCDALQTIDDAKVQAIEQYDERFKSLLVCQAHPVTLEFYALVDEAVERIKTLMCCFPINTYYMH